MTTTPNIAVTLKLDRLEELARFTAYLRADVTDAGAEGFGIEGGVMVTRSISRDAWEGLGCPVVLPITLRVVTPVTVEGADL